MSLVSLVLTLVFVGVLLYLLELVPMDGTIKTIIRIVVILFVIIWVIQQLGLWDVGPIVSFHHGLR